MVALARALMAGRKLLLLDEPFEGLAPALARRLGEVMANLKSEKVSILISESNEIHVADLLSRAFPHRARRGGSGLDLGGPRPTSTRPTPRVRDIPAQVKHGSPGGMSPRAALDLWQLAQKTERLREETMTRIVAALLAAALIAPIAARAEVEEIKIPRGAGGVGFLPLLMMEQKGLVEQEAQKRGIKLKPPGSRWAGPRWSTTC